MDCHQANKVEPRTLERYRTASRPFVDWLADHGLQPTSAEDWDDVLVEYRSEADVKMAAFAHLVSAVEMFFPRFKGGLAWSHAVLVGMAVSHTPRHTVPCGRHHARFLGAHFCSKGLFRLGVGIAVQQNVGLRPSELLGLRSRDLMFSDECGSLDPPHVVIRLGARKGTKAKRPQYAIIHAAKEPELITLLRRIRDSSAIDQLLIGVSIDAYRRHIRLTESLVGIKIGWGPHSPRAGFATDAIASRVPFTDVQEIGRWASASSLRTYVDVVTAASVQTQIAGAHLREAVAFTNRHFTEYFPTSCFGPGADRHASPRVQEAVGRVLCTSSPRAGSSAPRGLETWVSSPSSSGRRSGSGRRTGSSSGGSTGGRGSRTAGLGRIAAEASHAFASGKWS